MPAFLTGHFYDVANPELWVAIGLLIFIAIVVMVMVAVAAINMVFGTGFQAQQHVQRQATAAGFDDLDRRRQLLL